MKTPATLGQPEQRWSGRPEDSWGPADANSGLDRSMIATAVDKVKPQALACSTKSSAKGKIKIHVEVAPDGHVTSTLVESAPDPALGACVASAMQNAVFGRTQSGGSFTYPFTF